MKAVFEIEWPDELGENWMQDHNLALCIGNTCKGVAGIKIKAVDDPERSFHYALGWMYGEACTLLDKAEDLRKVKVPDLIARCKENFALVPPE